MRSKDECMREDGSGESLDLAGSRQRVVFVDALRYISITSLDVAGASFIFAASSRSRWAWSALRHHSALVLST